MLCYKIKIKLYEFYATRKSSMTKRETSQENSSLDIKVFSAPLTFL